jgi:hypothetical protein
LDSNKTFEGSLKKLNRNEEELTEMVQRIAAASFEKRERERERESICLDEKVINLKGEAKIFISDLKNMRIISLQIAHRLGFPWERAK